MTPTRTSASACSPAGRSFGSLLAARAGGFAVGVAGAHGVEGHRGGDLAGPQRDPGAGRAVVGAEPGFGGQVIGEDGDPVALADRVGGAAGQDAEGGDFDPAGDAVPVRPGTSTARRSSAPAVPSRVVKVRGSSPRRPVTVMAMGFMASPWCGPGEPAALVAARGLRCPSRRSGARDADAGARIPGGPGAPRCFPAAKEGSAGGAGPIRVAAAGERSVAARVSAAKARLREPRRRRKLTSPG